MNIKHKICWFVAKIMPARIALYAFVRVCAYKGECPDPFYSEYYKGFCVKNDINE